MQSRYGVSNLAFAGAVIILLIVAGAGYTLYFTKTPTTVTSISVRTSVSTQTTTAITTSRITAPPLTSGGFYDSKSTAYIYYANYTCNPPLLKFFSDQKAAAGKTSCEVGAGDKSSIATSVPPVWVLIPVYAGLSIFGVQNMGASYQGFPTYHNQTILTNCGAGGTRSQCPDHPSLIYSPAFTAVEQHLGIKTGFLGLPEGVLPTPAHSHLVEDDVDGKDVPWYDIAVLVFDPNILPNPVTAACTKIAPSNLSNATGNCLNSFEALQKALVTTNEAIAQANADNPIWKALGKPTTQVVIPGVSMVSEIKNPNSNLVTYFAVKEDINPYLRLANSNEKMSSITLTADTAGWMKSLTVLAAGILGLVQPPVGQYYPPYNPPPVSSTTTTSKAASTVAISIQNGASLPPGTSGSSAPVWYSPPTITVVIGVNNAVIWTNHDSVGHTVTDNGGAFDSGILNPGQSFSHTYTTPGTYQYHCRIHAWMTGTLTVKSATPVPEFPSSGWVFSVAFLSVLLAMAARQMRPGRPG